MRYKCRTMTEKLTHIQRFRFSEKTAKKLSLLKGLGISKSNFVREAIEEKLNTEFPKMIEAKRTPKLPF